jgi:ADP-ribosyl-[dinitrogen reductase] hydrolase
MGGDTDTNACIVGGLLGALVSIKNIPDKMVDKMKEFDCTDACKRRPEFLSVKK